MDLRPLAHSNLVALWQRYRFLQDIQDKRPAVAHLMQSVSEQKASVVEEATAKFEDSKDITQYVADHFELAPRDRARIETYLKKVYPQKPIRAWNAMHDASLFNTARHCYEKAAGVMWKHPDGFGQRVYGDRQEKKLPALRQKMPILTGIGLERVQNEWVPMFLYGYSTADLLMMTSRHMSDSVLEQMREDPLRQVALARRTLAQDNYAFKELYQRPDCPITITVLKPEHRYKV